ncbi:MAG: hypothetical protein ACTSUD_12090 [Alphaproteobacteria bacterium]
MLKHKTKRNDKADGPKKSRVHQSVVKDPRHLSFKLESRSSGRHAAYCGFLAAALIFGVAVYQVLKAVFKSGVDPSQNWAVFAMILAAIGLQGAAVIGLYYYSRIAAGASFAILAVAATAVYLVDGMQSPKVMLVVVVLLLALLQGIRGTIAYHRYPRDHRYIVPR